MKRGLIAVVGAALIAGFGGTAQAQTPRQPAAKGEPEPYFYRQKVKVSHKDEMFDFDIVVTCGGGLVKKFGVAAASMVPRFYALRTKNNHAIGVRPTSGCGGLTTENGGAPPDLLPSIYWFPDADDLSFGIMYVTEDAYENPLSQLKFHGSTMHRATLADFMAGQERAKKESLYPADVVSTIRKSDSAWNNPSRLEDVLARGAKPPKPNYAAALGCAAASKHKLSAEGSHIVRQFWPPHKPQYWSTGWNSDPAKTLFEFEHKYQNSKRILENGKMTKEYSWTLYLPNMDGLPTRAGGGTLRHLDRATGKGKHAGAPVPVPELYPISTNLKAAFYSLGDRDKDSVWRNIDMQSGQTKGFAYCGLNVTYFPVLSATGAKMPPHVLQSYYFPPALEERRVEYYVGKQLVDTTMNNPPLGANAFGIPRLLTFERDQAVFIVQQYQ